MRKNKPKKFHSQPWILLLIAMIIVVVLIPLSLPLIYSCLRSTSQESHFYHQCRVGEMLDKMIMLQIVSTIIFGLLTYIKQVNNRVRYSIINVVVGFILSIAMFYLSLPIIMKRVESSPVIISPESFMLDSP